MTEPGDLPPDLPPEYADAYRRGYQRAFGSPIVEPLEAPPLPVTEPAARDWQRPAVIAAAVVAVLLGSYGIGRVFAGGDEQGSPPAVQASGGEPAPSSLEGAPWDGDLAPVKGAKASSRCVLPPGVDSAGRRVVYVPGRALDGDLTTAWRCAGNGRGVTFRLALPETVRLAELGIVPGYAKTDPQSGTDRYAENNRLTRVRWTFADGRSVVQTLDGSPRNRRVQTLRIPPTETETLTLEILTSVRGARNTVAISEIELGRAVG